MFVNNKQDYVNALLVREKGTNLCLMVGEASKPLPEKYDVLKAFKNVPREVVSMLNFPRPLEECLHLLIEDGRKSKEYTDKNLGYQDDFIEILGLKKK